MGGLAGRTSKKTQERLRLSTSDESQMFSLSALTQSASRPSRPPRADEQDSGLIDLARLTAEVEAEPPLGFQPPPLFAPQAPGPLAAPQGQPAPRRRSPLPLLAGAGVAIVVAVGALAWLTSEPPPVLPSAEVVAPTPTPLEVPVVPPAPKPALAPPAGEPPQVAEQALPTPDSEEMELADPPRSLVRPRPAPRPKAPSPRERPKQATAPAKPNDPCARCAPGDLRCNMRCRAH